jgi:hypothetical protein
VSGTDSLVLGTVARMRSSFYQQPDDSSWSHSEYFSMTPTGVGCVTATTAFPFDVLTGTGVFSKTTVLVVDLDAVVYDCMRVLRWCTAQLSNSAAAPASPCGGTASGTVPSLESVFCCFLSTLREVIGKSKMTVELILGNCEHTLTELSDISLTALTCDEGEVANSVENHSTWDARRVGGGRSVLNSTEDNHGRSSLEETSEELATQSGVDATASAQQSSNAATGVDPSIATLEHSCIWLQLYQTIVLFLCNKDSGVGELTSFYATAKPNWTVAVARVTLLCESPPALNQ